jgi:hypothetical protein
MRQKGGTHRSNRIRLRGLLPPRLVPSFGTLAKVLQKVHDGELVSLLASPSIRVSQQR